MRRAPEQGGDPAASGDPFQEIERTGYAQQHLVDPENRALLEAFVDYFQTLDRDLRILELGCGDGFWLETLRNLGFRRLIGVDRSLPLLEMAAEKGLDVRCGDLYDMEVRNLFDVVLFCDTLEHLPDPQEALLRAHRALRTHGTVFIMAPVYESVRCRWERMVGRRSRWEQARRDDPSHLHAFSSSALLRLVEECHFALDRMAFVANWWPGGRMVRLPRGRWGKWLVLSATSLFFVDWEIPLRRARRAEMEEAAPTPEPEPAAPPTSEPEDRTLVGTQAAPAESPAQQDTTAPTEDAAKEPPSEPEEPDPSSPEGSEGADRDQTPPDRTETEPRSSEHKTPEPDPQKRETNSE